MVFSRCCKQRIIPFFTVYRWWELKLWYSPLKVGLRYTDDLIPCSVRVTDTSRKVNLLYCSFSIVNCIDGRIEFTWSSNIWTSPLWGQRMNVSSTYLSHIDGFSDVDPYAISSKYSMYMLANTDDNGEPIASPSCCWYISHPEVGCLHTESFYFILFKLLTLNVAICIVRLHLCNFCLSSVADFSKTEATAPTSAGRPPFLPARRAMWFRHVV